MPETLVWEGHDTEGHTRTGTLNVETVPPAIAGKEYRLVFAEDFDRLDPTIWGPQPQHRTTVPPGAYTVADSVLTVRADQTRPRAYEELTSLGPWQAAVPHYPNAHTWQYGYFEIRARCTSSAWSKLALWFFSVEAPNYHGASRPCARLNSEWDMVENGIRAGWEVGATADRNHVSVLHRNTNGVCGQADTSRQYSVNGTGLCDWHVWGGLWTPTTVSTFLDGRLLGSQATYDTTSQPMYLIVSAAPLTGGQTQADWPPKPAFVETQIDWIRVWQQT